MTSARSIISRYVAFGHVGHGFGSRRNRKPARSMEQIRAELAQHLAAVTFHAETRRMIAERSGSSRQSNGLF